MVKGKFVYIFADGTRMTDRNQYKTIAGAKSWAKAHNSSPATRKSEKIIKVLKKLKAKRRK